jgi:hypothetical protein
MKPKGKPRKRDANAAPDDITLAQRYGHFGDTVADDSAEEERHVRARFEHLDGNKDDDDEEEALLRAACATLFGDDEEEPPPPAHLQLDASLVRCVEMVYFGRPQASTQVIEASTAFAAQSKALADAVFARVDSLFVGNAELSSFHAALRRMPSPLRLEQAPEGLAAKQWLDVCRASKLSIPVNTGYCVLTCGDHESSLRVAIPRSMAHLLGLCHLVYHLVDYLYGLVLSTFIDPTAASGTAETVWSRLCGGVDAYAKVPVSQWKWVGAPSTFVQQVVHLRTALEAAQSWVSHKN